MRTTLLVLMSGIFILNLAFAQNVQLENLTKKETQVFTILKKSGSFKNAAESPDNSAMTKRPSHLAASDLIIVHSINAPAGNCRGLAWGNGYLWVNTGNQVNADTIYQVDPVSGAILSRYLAPGPPTNFPIGLTWDDTSPGGPYLWNSDENTDVLSQIRVSDFATVSSIPSPDMWPRDMAWDGANLWCAGSYQSKIYKLNPSDGTVLFSFNTPLDKPAGLTWDNDSPGGPFLWHSNSDFLGSDDFIYQINPANGDTIKTYHSPGTYPSGLAWDHDSPGGPFLWCVDWDTDIIYKLQVPGLGPNPTASFTVTPTIGVVGTLFSFDASSSIDAQTPTPQLEVRWDWENNGTYDTPWTTTKTATHQYASAGTYTIKLEVKDADSNTGSTTRSVVVVVPATVPWSDNFPTTSLDAIKWPVNNGPAVINTNGLNEPSSPYSLDLNATDEVRSQAIDLSGKSSVVLRYYYEMGGGGDNAESSNDLLVDYYSSAGNWVNLRQHLGGGSNMTSFVLVEVVLPADAYHSGFSIRFRTTGDAGSDDWFVDDVSLTLPPDITVTPTQFNVSLATVDSTTQTLTIGNVGTGSLTWSIGSTPTSASFKHEESVNVFHFSTGETSPNLSVNSGIREARNNSAKAGVRSSRYYPNPRDGKENVVVFIDDSERGQNTTQKDAAIDVSSSLDSIFVRLKIRNIPATLLFNQSHVPTNTWEYSWSIYFDSDGNSSTGLNGYDVEILLMHYKNGAPFTASILDGTFHQTIEWTATSGYTRHTINAKIDPTDPDAIILSVSKTWSETASIDPTDRYYFRTYYYAPGGSYSDETTVTTGKNVVVTDPQGDVTYDFIDIIEGSWNDETQPAISWLSCNPLSGSVSPGSSQDIAVKFRSVGLKEDSTYHANILITSNDPDQPTVTIPVTLTVAIGPNPIANFSIAPLSVYLGDILTVDASDSKDGQTPKAQLEVRWDWENDGTFDTPWSTDKIATHQYSTPGLKTIKLEVKDTDGNTDSTTQNKTVNSRSPQTFDLVSPLEGDTVHTVKPSFVWRTAVDVDPGDTLRYTLYYSKSSAFSISDTVKAGTDTTVTLPDSLQEMQYYYWKVEVIDRWENKTMSRQTTRRFLVADVTPPRFTIGILQNPIMTEDMDLYIIPNEALDANGARAVANGTQIAMPLLDPSNRIYAGDYQLSASGTLMVIVSGKDAIWGNEGKDTLTFQVQQIKVAEGGMITSGDARLKISFPGHAIDRDAYVMILPGEELKNHGPVLSRINEEEPDEVISIGKSYQIGPVQLPLATSVTLLFSYSAKEMGGKAEGKLEVARKEGVQWVSIGGEVDEKGNFITTQVNQLGEYRLQWNPGRVESLMKIPSDYALPQNYPNPFNPATNICYALPQGFHGQVVLTVYNIMGQKVKQLVDKLHGPGYYSVLWDGTDDEGRGVASGVYLYRLQADQFVAVNKMLFLR